MSCLTQFSNITVLKQLSKESSAEASTEKGKNLRTATAL